MNHLKLLPELYVKFRLIDLNDLLKNIVLVMFFSLNIILM